MNINSNTVGSLEVSRSIKQQTLLCFRLHGISWEPFIHWMSSLFIISMTVSAFRFSLPHSLSVLVCDAEAELELVRQSLPPQLKRSRCKVAAEYVAGTSDEQRPATQSNHVTSLQ